MAVLDIPFSDQPDQYAETEIDALLFLRRAVISGACRIGSRHTLDTPCLMGLIITEIPHGSIRDHVVDSISRHLPGGSASRSQMHIMRYCRSHGARPGDVLEAIEKTMLEFRLPFRRLPLRLWPRRLWSMIF